MKTLKALIAVLLVFTMLFTVSPVAFAADGDGDTGSALSEVEDKFKDAGSIFVAIVTAPFWFPLLLALLFGLQGDDANREKWFNIFEKLNPLIKL